MKSLSTEETNVPNQTIKSKRLSLRRFIALMVLVVSAMISLTGCKHKIALEVTNRLSVPVTIHRKYSNGEKMIDKIIGTVAENQTATFENAVYYGLEKELEFKDKQGTDFTNTASVTLKGDNITRMTVGLPVKKHQPDNLTRQPAKR